MTSRSLFNNRTTGIFLDGKTVHAVQVRAAAGKPVVEKAVSADFDGPQALRAALESRGIDTRRLVLCLPRPVATHPARPPGRPIPKCSRSWPG